MRTVLSLLVAAVMLPFVLVWGVNRLMCYLEINAPRFAAAELKRQEKEKARIALGGRSYKVVTALCNAMQIAALTMNVIDSLPAAVTGFHRRWGVITTVFLALFVCWAVIGI